MKFTTTIQVFLILSWGLVDSANASPQTTSPPQKPAVESTPLRPLEPSDTSSPATTLDSLIESCNELHKLIQLGAMAESREGEILPTSERILDCFDLSEFPKELRTTAGIESALFLKEVLDRIELPDDEDIPQFDNEESPEERHQGPASWQIPNTRITIARVEKGPHQNAFLFTPETVRQASQYFRIVKNLPYRTSGRPVSKGLYEAYLAATKKKPTYTADTSSPRGTLTLFLDSCNELYEAIEKNVYIDRLDPRYNTVKQRILNCLDLSQLPDFAREYFNAEAAVCLKEILDRVPLPAAEEIPGIENVEASDGSEALARWKVPRTRIVITRIQDGPRRGEFLFSAETVARAPEFFKKVVADPYRENGRPVSKHFYQWWLSRPGNPKIAFAVDQLPKSFQNRKFGLAYWQWLALLMVVPLCGLIILLTSRIGRGDPDRVRHSNLLLYWLSLAFPIMTMLVPLGFKIFLWEYLTIRGYPLYVLNFLADMVFLVALIALVIQSSSRIAETFIALPGVSPRGLDANLIRIVSRVLGIIVAAIIFLEGGRYLGFPLTTLIASAGIGGLAIALSAQGLIKGLFGTVTILLDRPFRVGDRIVIKNYDGFVEEIGLRSTKIRAFDKRIISIPNDLLAESEIENIGSLNHMRRIADIHIPLDTPRDKVEQAVACIRTVLESHVGPDSKTRPRVNFNEFNEDSFNIRVTYWFSPPNLAQFDKFSETVNLGIMKAFEQHGIQFSLPFRHTYWKTDDQQGPVDVALHNIDNVPPPQ